MQVRGHFILSFSYNHTPLSNWNLTKECDCTKKSISRAITIALILVCILGFIGHKKASELQSEEPTTPTINIEDTTTIETFSFHAKVLEVHDKYILAEHLPGGKTLSADIIEVPFEEKTSWPIPAVGDNVEVYYGGTIMETYPARLSNVYRVEILTIKLTS